MAANVIQSAGIERAHEVLRHVWGYDAFRPLQQDAVSAALAGRDSLVVLPTGGGKSICFQVPALCLDGMGLVVSPLISLMKDQVDSLQADGVAAEFVNSTQSLDEQRRIARDIEAGKVKLLYVSPERLLTDRMLTFLSRIPLSLIAIDEAHCVSDWGHDFRPEYRGLKALRKRFPNVAMHAYTATAADKVRADIVEQLELRDPSVLVGTFDRPNLSYRMLTADRRMEQIAEVMERHSGESGIIYCISRKEVERVAGALKAAGVRAAPYHAGMNEQDRKRNQEAFINDQVEVIVATVAFGMGIDKPDVRFVIHANMPKSIEHYQQESGRAGRDGLESECVLIYSRADIVTWGRIFEGEASANRPAMKHALDAMWDLCSNPRCRHKALSAYFGQELPGDNCGACDVCLEEIDVIDDALVIGQKILSCVLRLGERFGADYTCKVLTAASEPRIVEQQHDKLSTHGILKDHPQGAVRQWIEQLVAQQFLARDTEYQTLRVTPDGRWLLKGEVTPKLTQPTTTGKSKRSRQKTSSDSWDGVDRGLFAKLRELRSRLAGQRNVPAYVIFGDATLRDLARVRPATKQSFGKIRGVGDRKLEELADDFLQVIDTYCGEQGLDRDVQFKPSASKPAAHSMDTSILKLSAGSASAVPLFDARQSLEEVAQQLGRSRGTVSNYLADYLQYKGLTDPGPWVDAETVRVIEEAMVGCEEGRLKPIFDKLEGKVSYDEIRIVVTCHQVAQSKASSGH